MFDRLVFKPSVHVIAASVMLPAQLEEWAKANELTPLLGQDSALNGIYGAIVNEYEERGEHGFLGEASLDRIAETAGRFCYRSWEKGREIGPYLDNIVESGHGSVLRHATVVLAVSGISRTLSHELVRHHIGCLAGDSLIYCEQKVNGRRNKVARRRIDELFAMQQHSHGRSRIKLMNVRCLDHNTGLFSTDKIKRVLQQGVKPTFKVMLEDGRNITCTSDHKFFSDGEWKTLEDVVGGITIHGSVTAIRNPEAVVMVNGTLAYRDKNWLKNRYYEKGLDLSEIADQAGVSTHCIRKYIGLYGLAKPHGKGMLGKRPWNRGLRYSTTWKRTNEQRKHLSDIRKGSLNHQWRGGITKSRRIIDSEFKKLRAYVIARDGYKCLICDNVNKLEVHHLAPVWARPDLIAEKSNLATLCKTCHCKIQGREHEVHGMLATKIGEQPAVWEPRRRPKAEQTFAPKPMRIISVQYVGDQMTYDLEMESENHNFVSNGILVHNCDVSQESQRYVDAAEMKFVVPPLLVKMSDDLKTESYLTRFETKCRRDVDEYVRWQETYRSYLDKQGSTIDKKRVNEAARAVLPNACETRMVWTMNCNSARNVIAQRGAEGADLEIRRLAYQFADVFKFHAPNTFADFEKIIGEDGFPAVTCKHPKV